MLLLLVLLAAAPARAFLFGLARPGQRLAPPSPVRLNPDYGGEPVLTLTEPKTRSRVHLVGVAHGSSSSAALVDRAIAGIRPATVVVELCPERFLSISLEARIRPRFNESMTALYDEKIRILDAQEVISKKSGSLAGVKRTWSILRFVASQGLVAGLFILLGLSVASLQKLSRGGQSVSAASDEFVTAMIAAEAQDVELTLGDAPQSDTLNAVRRVFTPELFSPKQISEGALLLWFSVLGIGPFDSNKALGEKIPRELLDQSEWLSIPQTYWKNRKMFQGLAPLLVISFATTLSTLLLPLISGADLSALDAETATATSTIVAAAAAAAAEPGEGGVVSSVLGLLTAELPLQLEQAIDYLVDVFSVLLLIRLTKLIGTDRDSIIAGKIQDACRRYPGKDIVVVIGLLHSNGVARWLLSGEDPKTFAALGSSPSP